MLAPEERNGSKLLTISEHIACCCLPLPFRNYPMLDANAFSTVRIGPACDIACHENIRHIRGEKSSGDDTSVYIEAGSLSEVGPRLYADTRNHEVGTEDMTVLQPDLSTVDQADLVLKMEHYSMLLVQGTN